MRLKRPVKLAYSRDNFIEGPDVEAFCKAHTDFDGMMIDYNGTYEIGLANGEAVLEWIRN